jgi:hypothetical protein
MGKFFRGHFMIKDTLLLLVTCSLEKSRLIALQQVIENLKSMPDKAFLDHLLVFDNASTIPESDNLLTTNFKNVYKSSSNFGFWSAIKWTLDNYETILGREYKYLYVIESDMIHTSDAFQRLEHCEQFLDSRDDVGLVRVEEFSVANRHLYDKRNQVSDSRKYAWVVQDNYIEGKKVSFDLADAAARIYTCNFLAKVPTVTRIQTMKKVFYNLSELDSFNEMAFQRYYYDFYKKNALLDDGIFHSKLGNDNNVTLKGSYIGEEGRKIGYKETRNDRIIAIPESAVKRLA